MLPSKATPVVYTCDTNYSQSQIVNAEDAHKKNTSNLIDLNKFKCEAMNSLLSYKPNDIDSSSLLRIK